MENPQEWYQRTTEYFENKIRANPTYYSYYSAEQIHIRALGETYNNWILKLRRRDGSLRWVSDKKMGADTDELITILKIDKEELFDVLDKIDAYPSMDNPSFVDLDRLTKVLLFAMVERKGYTPLELIS